MPDPVAVRRRDVVRWASVVIALVSAGVHAAALATGAGQDPARLLVLAVAGMACLPCALHLALLPRPRAWLQTAATSAAMLLAHPLLPAGAGPGHHAGASAGAGTVLAASMTAVPAVGLVLAVAGLLAGRRAGATA